MAFLAKLDLDASSDARRSRRFIAHRLDAMLVGNDRRFDVIVHNISATGFLAEFSSELNPGDIVGLQLARVGFVEARVVRKRGFGHGCAFLAPVTEDVIAETIAASVSFAEDNAAATDPADNDESEGYRRRTRRERAGSVIVMTCLMLATLILFAALVWIFRR